ncbi:MAG: 23S rRNA (adenine(2503)-C(2))-methyltransferase RlmN [Bacteroidales bacterium]|nr:23S rRNA (adenine(2503)-C(2))-methyltransferase RlmN [Bacteroidales bacterium]
MEKTRLLGMTPDQLKEIALEAGLPGFTGKQIAQWIYGRRVRTIGEMTNLSKAGRERLSERYEVGVAEPVGKAESSDGTRKYLFPVNGDPGNAVEAVMIPDGDRKTLCVSSQAGCKMGCKFCMTGRQGFHGSLSAADILSQFFGIDEAGELTNSVFMGMGEPLDNWEEVKRVIDVLTAPWGFAWSPKRITLSTIGVLPNLKRFLDESKCHLAVSLHDPFPEERATLMPVEKAYPIRDVISLIRKYDFTGQRRVSFEYTMFAGHNDTPRHADALLRLLQGLECRVNLIRFHRIPDFPYGTSSQAAMEAFRDRLARGGLTATIRASRGEDILAACGLLAGLHNHA